MPEFVDDKSENNCDDGKREVLPQAWAAFVAKANSYIQKVQGGRSPQFLPPRTQLVFLRAGRLRCIAMLWNFSAAFCVPYVRPKGDAAARLGRLEPDAQLVQLCLRGDGPAWEELVRRHTRRVYNLCYRFTGNRDRRRGFESGSFSAHLRTLASYQPAYGAFPTWLTSVTRNLLVDHYRRTRRDRMTDSIDDAMPQLEEKHSPARTPDKLARSVRVERAIATGTCAAFPGTARGGDPARSARTRLRGDPACLQVPEGTVKSRINRGRIELARVLGEMGVRPS